MKHPITITETLSKTIDIEADTMEEALIECENLYNKSEIVLASGDFDNIVNFEIVDATSTDIIIDKVAKDIEKINGITLDQIKSRNTSPKIATARRIMYYILENYYNLIRLDIATYLHKTRPAITVSLKVWLDNNYIKEQEFSQYEKVLTKYK